MLCCGHVAPAAWPQAEALTPLGALLSTLPVDVPTGKLLVLTALFGLPGPGLSLAAALAVHSPFLRLAPDSQRDQEVGVPWWRRCLLPKGAVRVLITTALRRPVCV